MLASLKSVIQQKQRQQKADGLSKPPALTDRVGILCNGLKGLFIISSQTIVCGCALCARSSPKGFKVMTPTEFERHSGMQASKKWRRSIKTEHDPNMSVGRWLETNGFQATIGKQRIGSADGTSDSPPQSAFHGHPLPYGATPKHIAGGTPLGLPTPAMLAPSPIGYNDAYASSSQLSDSEAEGMDGEEEEERGQAEQQARAAAAEQLQRRASARRALLAQQHAAMSPVRAAPIVPPAPAMRLSSRSSSREGVDPDVLAAADILDLMRSSSSSREVSGQSSEECYAPAAARYGGAELLSLQPSDDEHYYEDSYVSYGGAAMAGGGGHGVRRSQRSHRLPRWLAGTVDPEDSEAIAAAAAGRRRFVEEQGGATEEQRAALQQQIFLQQQQFLLLQQQQQLFARKRSLPADVAAVQQLLEEQMGADDIMATHGDQLIAPPLMAAKRQRTDSSDQLASPASPEQQWQQPTAEQPAAPAAGLPANGTAACLPGSGQEAEAATPAVAVATPAADASVAPGAASPSAPLASPPAAEAALQAPPPAPARQETMAAAGAAPQPQQRASPSLQLPAAPAPHLNSASRRPVSASLGQHSATPGPKPSSPTGALQAWPATTPSPAAPQPPHPPLQQVTPSPLGLAPPSLVGVRASAAGCAPPLLMDWKEVEGGMLQVTVTTPSGTFTGMVAPTSLETAAAAGPRS